MVLLSMLISEGILTLRTWAVWGLDTKIGILMWIVFFAFLAGCAAGDHLAMRGVMCMPRSFPTEMCLTSSPVSKFPIPTRFDFAGCFLTGGNIFLSISWMSLLAYDAWMVSWLSVRSIQICKLSCITGDHLSLLRTSIHIHRPPRRTGRSHDNCV